MYSMMNIIISLVINIFSKLYNYIYQDKYQRLLESPKNYKIGMEKIDKISINDNLVKIIDSFMIRHNLYDKGVIVSLSGGVDSMVVLTILIRLKKEKDFPIYASTINYNLRKESFDEAEFVREYCQKNNVEFFIESLEGAYSNGNKRTIKLSGSSKSEKRSVFEETSREIRFALYEKIINEKECLGVMTGHHEDDIIENIFTNSMKGHNLLDIEVMKEKSNIRNINIFRPLLKNRKCEIFKFSHKYDIPYFVDTTPKWSRRGQMRNEIFPLFTKVFSKSWKNKFKEIGTQSNNWNDTVKRVIINPWFSEVNFCKYGFILPIKYTNDQNLWSYMMPKLFFKINYSTIKRRSIFKILELLNDNKYNKSFILDSGFMCFITEPSSSIINSRQLVIYNLKDIQKNLLLKDTIDNKIINFLNGVVTDKINYKNLKVYFNS